jgi:hypothetical protein
VAEDLVAGRPVKSRLPIDWPKRCGSRKSVSVARLDFFCLPRRPGSVSCYRPRSSQSGGCQSSNLPVPTRRVPTMLPVVPTHALSLPLRVGG